jgi:hypothetical protein
MRTQRTKRSGPKYQVLDLVAGLERDTGRYARVDFQNAIAGPAGWDQAFGKRFGVSSDARDCAGFGDEDHIEGNIGILHPERDRLLALEVEQHAAIRRHEPPIHQAFFTFGVVARHFDRKNVNAGRGGDLEPVKSLRRRADMSEQYELEQTKERRQ